MFKQNSQNMKTTVSISTKFYKQQRPSKTLNGWSKHACNKSKMADGSHIEKKSKTTISQQRLDRLAPNLVLKNETY